MLTLLALLGAPSLACAAAAASAGFVAQVQGQAEVERAGRQLVPSIGLLVEQGDVLATGADGRIEIEFYDGTRLIVGPATRLALGEIRFGAGGNGRRGILSIVRGVVRAIIAPSGWSDGFEVRSRAGVAAVRSTEFIVEADEANMAVFVLAGEVAVSGSEPPPATSAPAAAESRQLSRAKTALRSRTDSALVASAGSSVALLRGRPPQAPQAANAEQLQQLLRRTSF